MITESVNAIAQSAQAGSSAKLRGHGARRSVNVSATIVQRLCALIHKYSTMTRVRVNARLGFRVIAQDWL